MRTPLTKLYQRSSKGETEVMFDFSYVVQLGDDCDCDDDHDPPDSTKDRQKANRGDV